MTDTATAPSPAANRGGPRPKPTYAAEKVDEIPEELTKRGGPRTDPGLLDALNVAQQDAGEIYCVATFESEGGAKTKLKAIKDGKVKIPSGEWDFEARRVQAPEGKGDGETRWSKLYAKYLG